MAILKKTAAVLTAVMISASVCSCGADTAYALKADGKEVKAGVYIDYLFNEISTQITTLSQQGVQDEFLKQSIDGKDFSDYVSEAALKNTKEYAVINAKFDELKLTVDDDTLEQINSSISDAWEQQSQIYEKEGISKESLKNVLLASAKRSAIFSHYFAKDGVEAVSDEELAKYVDDNYLRYKIIYMQKDSTDSDADKEAKDLRDSYLKKADGLSFEDFDKIIDEYSEYQTKKNAEESESQTESSVESSVVDSSADESSAADSSAAEEKDESSKADSSSSEAESEADPYKNEKMVNYSEIDEDTLENAYGKAMTKIKELKEGVATAYEDDSAYYILIKGNVKERSKEYSSDTDNHDNILYQMKSDDFQKYIDEWVEKADIEVNDKAIKRYTVQKVYDIRNEQSE